MSTSRFSVTYPPSNRIVLDGGLNSKFERSIIKDNESPDCLNVVFSNGSVATRGGTAKLNTAAIGSFVGDGIYTRRTDGGVESMVVFAGGTMWVLSGTSFATVASAQSVFTAGIRVSTTQYENHMFIGNGGVDPYKYNGDAFTRHGVPAPTTTATVASNGAGNVTGSVSYKITYVNSQLVEGNPSPITTTFTATATGSILRLTSIPVAPQSHGVNSRRLYRTESGGTTWKRVTEIADNTTTTYDDNTLDANLGVAPPSDNGEPPKYSVVCYHANRLFCNDTANPNLVWYSNLAEPYTFGSANFVRIGDATADLVKGLAVYDNSVVVMCENSAWLIYMPSTTPSDWQLVRLKSPYGSKSPFGLALFDNKLFFPAMQNSKIVGFAAIEGDGVQPSATLLTVSSAGSLLKSDKIEPDIFDIQEPYAGNISSFVFKNKVWTAVTYGNNATQNNRVFVYDFSISNVDRGEPAWVPFTFPTNKAPAQFTVYDGKLYYVASSATGFVYQADTTDYNDDGAAINSYIWTKEFSGRKEHENDFKDFRQIVVLFDKAGAYYMNVTYRVDSDSGVGDTLQLSLDPDATLWGSFSWGMRNWGGGQEQQEVRQSLGALRGKRIQLRFSNQNTVNQRFKVHGIKFTYNVKGAR